jgi:4,5-dihydroxyphthalate decarboxylase
MSVRPTATSNRDNDVGAGVMTLRLKMACWDYDRTRPLVDGRVAPEGVTLDISMMRPRQAFERMLEKEEFDIGEVSLASYVRLKAEGDDRFVGIPVAMSKIFRHSCIYVRAGSGIKTPADLRDKRIGVSQLDSTGIVFIKGMLQHDFGVSPRQMEWFVGGLETPAAAPPTLPNDHGTITPLGLATTLVAELRAGGIDVLLSNHIPSSFKTGAADVSRLFPDFKTVEIDYFRRTGIFPVMHVMVMRGELHQRHPSLAPSLYRAFCDARDIAVFGLYDTDALRLALPWLIDHVEEATRVLGPDFWSYGLEPNRPAFEAICRYMVEQGLARRQLQPEELFVALA